MGKKFAKKSAVKKTSTSVKVNNKQQNKLKRGGVKKNSQAAKKTVRKAKKTKNLDKKKGQMEEVAPLFSTQSLRKMAVHDNQIDMELSSLDLKKRKLSSNGDRGGNKRKFSSDRSDGDSDDNDDLEANYKMKSYLIDGMKKSQAKQYSLPIKTIRGELKLNEKPELYEEEAKPTPKIHRQPSGQQSVPESYQEEPEEPKSLIEQIREKKIFYDKTKEKIALLARDVLQNPQEEMKKLKELRTLLTLSEVKSSYVLRKLIIVSLAEVFKDILPGYRIRPWSEKESNQNLSKEVKQLKEYEESLLKQYKLYLDYLTESLKTIYKLLFKPADKPITGSERASIKAYGVVCVRCLCGLIERLSHFNFANEIIQTIVEQLASRVEEISDLAISSIESIFQNDKDLKLSLEITQKITRIIKQKSFGVKPTILDIFLSLKLKEIKIVEEKKKKLTHKEKMKLSRTERKKLKEKEQLENELQEKSLTDRLKIKSNLQTKILEQIFMIYFNILKKNPNFKLMPSVLEGLAKFAHLINLDFFDDLVKVMHSLIESDQLTFRSKLHCIKTIFIVLSGQGEALTIDPMKFYTALYNIILKFDTLGNAENTMLLIECLDMMFIKRKKQIPTARLLAFIKRLSNMTVNLNPVSVNIILSFFRKLVNLNKQSDLLFDNEYQYSGIYNPELTEPDYANAQSTALWELHILRRHYNHTVAMEAADILKQENLEETRKTPQEIADEMNAQDLEFLESEPKHSKRK